MGAGEKSGCAGFIDSHLSKTAKGGAPSVPTGARFRSLASRSDLKLYFCISSVRGAELFRAEFGGVGAGGEADFSCELAVEVEGQLDRRLECGFYDLCDDLEVGGNPGAGAGWSADVDFTATHHGDLGL